MPYKMLVASDIDDTLLPEGQTRLNPALFDEIRRLKDCGILFCAASGRPLDTLREMFAPVADEIAYLAENGAHIYYGTVHLETITMPHALCAELCAYLAARSDCVARACTTLERCYMVPTQAARDNLEAVGVEFSGTKIVHDFSEVHGEVTQITAVSGGDIRIPAAEILPLWQNRIGAAINGEHWLDFTAAGKDVGMQRLCAHFGIPMAQTIAFGDNFNDAPMLRTAGKGYLMAHAAPELRAEFPLQTDSVLKVLKGIG